MDAQLMAAGEAVLGMALAIGFVGAILHYVRIG